MDMPSRWIDVYNDGYGTWYIDEIRPHPTLPAKTRREAKGYETDKATALARATKLATRLGLPLYQDGETLLQKGRN